MLPHRISTVLIIFDAFGFNSGWTKLSNSPLSVALFRLLNILSVSFFTHYKYHFVMEYYSSFGIIDKVNEMIALSVPLYAWWLVIIDSFLQQHSHKQFWTIIQQINDRYCDQSKYNYRPYLLKFIEFFIVTSLFAIFVLASTALQSSEMFLDLLFAFAHVLLIKVLHMRIFYYLFCLDLVNFQLKVIDCEMTSIKNCDLNKMNNYGTENMGQISKMSFLSSKSKRFHEYSGCTFELVNHLNEIFGWSQVIAIPSCFYLLLTDLNWMFSFYDIIPNSTLIG